MVVLEVAVAVLLVVPEVASSPPTQLSPVVVALPFLVAAPG